MRIMTHDVKKLGCFDDVQEVFFLTISYGLRVRAHREAMSEAIVDGLPTNSMAQSNNTTRVWLVLGCALQGKGSCSAPGSYNLSEACHLVQAEDSLGNN